MSFKGVEFKGVAFVGFGGFDGFGRSGKHPALLSLVFKMQDKDATVVVLTVLAVSTVVAVPVVTAPPLNSTPLFRNPETDKMTSYKGRRMTSQENLQR